jgi:diguanylate cyclase (GGDEF)-like protein
MTRPASGPVARVVTADGIGPRAARLRERGRGCCVVAPVVVRGRAWGELYVARGPQDPVFDFADARFATILTEVVAAGIAQNEQLEAVRRLAFTDQLTGLANRRAVEAGLDEGLARHRTEGTVVSLVVCDVNGLKRVNDEFGHAAGDRLLERFGMVLSLAGARLPDALAARLGGDEFCLLTIGPSADRVARAAEDVCRRALALRGGEGVSCGVASTGDPIGPVRTAARLFRLADAAQYRAKADRALHPVIAGREGAEGVSDPVLRLADTAHPTGGDRRTIRSHHPEPEPDELHDPGRSGEPGHPDRSRRGGPRVPTPGL